MAARHAGYHVMGELLQGHILCTCVLRTLRRNHSIGHERQWCGAVSQRIRGGERGREERKGEGRGEGGGGEGRGGRGEERALECAD